MLIPSKCGGLVDRPALSLCLDKGRTSAIVNARPGMRMQWFLLMLLAMLTLQGCVKSPTPIPPGTDTYFYGYLTEGGKFGVKIGDGVEGVKYHIRKYSSTSDALDECKVGFSHKFSNCKKGELIGYYRVRKPLRDGFIYVIYRDNKAVGIAWKFDWLPPMDF